MRHLLSINDLTRDDMERILDRAAAFEEVSHRDIKKVPALRGRTVLNLFYEASTRTRSSFELAAKRLSADVVNFSAGGSSVEKGESLKDTVLTLTAHSPDAIVIRTPFAGAAALVAGWTPAAIVNAGDGKHEHPTQALLDAYTLRQKLGSLEGRNIWIVGDVAHSRVARSNILAFRKMGADVTVCGPPTLIPRGIEALGCAVRYDLADLRQADVVYALRMQHERMDQNFVPSLREYAANYQINGRRLGPHQVLMHPGPGQPRRRALRRGGRLAAGGHHDAGQGGGGRPHGGALRGARRRARRTQRPASDRAAAGMSMPRASPHRRLRRAPRQRARAARRPAAARRPRARSAHAAWTAAATCSCAAARSPRSPRPAPCPHPTAARSSRARGATCSRRSSIPTCTCARPARSTRRTSRPARARPRPAATAPSSRCRTRRRRSTAPRSSARCSTPPRARRACRSASCRRSRAA